MKKRTMSSRTAQERLRHVQKSERNQTRQKDKQTDRHAAVAVQLSRSTLATLLLSEKIQSRLHPIRLKKPSF